MEMKANLIATITFCTCRIFAQAPDDPLIIFYTDTARVIRYDSLVVTFCGDTSLSLSLSTALTVETRLRVEQPETVGTIYELQFRNPTASVRGIVKDTVRGWWGPGCFEFIDLTFDGYLDFRIRVDTYRYGHVYHTYIYEPAQHAFLLCGTCEELLEGMSHP
jgi:hypothetical protein